MAEQVDFAWDGAVVAEQTTVDPAANVRSVAWDYDTDGIKPIAQSERIEWRDAPQAWVDQRFYSIVTDLVGTPTELVDSDGALAWHATNTLWGRTNSRSATTDIPLRFPGQYFDAETGLHYNYHRYYDPEIGRYTSSDPLGLAPAPNPDAYVDNAHTWVDPFGLACRNGAFREAKRDLGIPIGQQPDAVTRVPMTDRWNHAILDSNGRPIMTREYHYTRSDGSHVIIQDHAAGHDFRQGGEGDQGAHFNVRPAENPRTGHVPGTKLHYSYEG